MSPDLAFSELWKDLGQIALAALDEDNPASSDVFDNLERSLLLAESSDLRGRQHGAAIDAVDRRVGHELGLVHMPANRSIRLTARQVADDNRTSPRDMAFLLEKIYKRDIVSVDASDQMMDILKHQKLRDRLPRFIPTGWEIAHKTGLLRKNQAFRERFHFQRDDEISHQLHSRGISVLAKVVNGLPQMTQDWFYFFENCLVARSHNPKLCVGRFLFAAKDRRIEKVDAALWFAAMPLPMVPRPR